MPERPSPGPDVLPITLALAWTGLITVVLWLALSAAVSLLGGRAQDIAVLGAVQVVVYAALVRLFCFTQRLPQSELLARRQTTLRLCLTTAVLGATLQIPATIVSNIVDRFFPLPDGVLLERVARITPHSTAHGIAVFAVVALLGPFVEELFFRGALFGALRRGHSAIITTLVVSLCFALGHLDLRLLLPLFLVALVIGDVRERSGSIWPGLALHAAFNSATLAVVFSGNLPSGKPPPMQPAFAVLGCVLSAALLVLAHRIATDRSSGL